MSGVHKYPTISFRASFEDCEEQDDDVEIMQTEETAPI